MLPELVRFALPWLEVVTVSDLFARRSPPILADWFTGRLRCPVGELLRYVHGGYMSTFERDLLIDVEKGRVVREWEHANSSEDDPLEPLIPRLH